MRREFYNVKCHVLRSELKNRAFNFPFLPSMAKGCYLNFLLSSASIIGRKTSKGSQVVEKISHSILFQGATQKENGTTRLLGGQVVSFCRWGLLGGQESENQGLSVGSANQKDEGDFCTMVAFNMLPLQTCPLLPSHCRGTCKAGGGRIIMPSSGHVLTWKKIKLDIK